MSHMSNLHTEIQELLGQGVPITAISLILGVPIDWVAMVAAEEEA